jgi:hypothetical protein
MAISEGDYEALMLEIDAAVGRKIKGETAKKIEGLLKEMGWKDAKNIVFKIVKSERIPVNIYGFVGNLWREIKTNRETEFLSMERWKTDPNCCTPEQWALWLNITSEIMMWHLLGLAKRYAESVVGPETDYIQWMQLGQPKTWSPLLDHLFKQMIPFFQNRITKSEELTQFLREYFSMLSCEREKRLCERTEKQKQIQLGKIKERILA